MGTWGANLWQSNRSFWSVHLKTPALLPGTQIIHSCAASTMYETETNLHCTIQYIHLYPHNRIGRAGLTSVSLSKDLCSLYCKPA